VVKYNTTYDDAVAGARPKNAELSLRIRREAAGDIPEAELMRGLKAAADACQVRCQVIQGWCRRQGSRLGWQPQPCRSCGS
jgi:predicted Zn-ribbon and HTH transcriptional regulator